VDNFLLLSIFGILALYFYSSMITYKSLYSKTIEEKKLLDVKIDNLEKLKDKSEKQIEFSLATINDSQNSLKSTRDDFQELKLKNTELEHRNKLLQERVDELYNSVGTI
jgi:peptidoglycan hydrolase CwlO-like protein